jgi:hypothetical protein
LWQVDDQCSAQVAKDVYASMLAAEGIDAGETARGLHHAVRKLREVIEGDTSDFKRFKGDPLRWAPYMHIGA